MSNIRIRFVRGEEVKYISHLDLMKVFGRALRRARLPIAYSQGFNPHAHMVFGLPLSVGVTSEAEYADFELTEEIPLDEFTERLNRELPDGFNITDAKVRHKKDNIMALISMATYEVLVSSDSELGINILQDNIKDFLEKPVLMVKKEGKNGVKDIDIRPMIHELFVRSIEDLPEQSMTLHYINKISNAAYDSSYNKNNVFCISMLISAGSVANLKPELLISAFNNVSELYLKVVKIHRTGLFIGKERRVADPLDPGVL